MLALAAAAWLQACAAQLSAAAAQLAPKHALFERARAHTDGGVVRLRIAGGPWTFVVTVRETEPAAPREWHLMRRRGLPGFDEDRHTGRSERREARLEARFTRGPKAHGVAEERFAEFAAAFRPAAERCLEAK
jgi:hypothetical protein